MLGNYGIHVTSGEVTINGATLRTSEKIHWVDAPHCHALPVIRCPEAATLELLPRLSIAGLRSLANLSPQLRRLWNEGITPSNENAASSDPMFQIVSIPYISIIKHKHTADSICSYILQRTVRKGRRCRISSRLPNGTGILPNWSRIPSRSHVP